MAKATLKQVEAALEASGGWQSIAAKKLGMTSSAISQRIGKSKHLQETVFRLKEKYLDLAEIALIKLIKDGNLGAICFYLKCQGKKRGYVEGLHILPGDDNQVIKVEVIDADPKS